MRMCALLRARQMPLPQGETADPAFLIHPDHLNLEEVMAFEALRPFPNELITEAAVQNPLLRSVVPYDRVIRYVFGNSYGGYEGVWFTSSGNGPERDIPWLIGRPSVSRFRDRMRIEVLIDAFEAE